MILQPLLPDAKRLLIGNGPEAGKDGRPRKRAAEDEIIRYHHQLNGMSLSTLKIEDRGVWPAAVMGTQRAGKLKD